MSRRHVYGKRSRAIYDPLEAFASPQRTPEHHCDDRSKVAATTLERSRKITEDAKKSTKTAEGRKALGEINANEVVKPLNPLKATSKNKRTHRRKIVVDEDEEEDFVEKQLPMAKDLTVVEIKEVDPQVPEEPSLEDPQRCDSAEVDDVPLFCNDHGYDTDDEERDHHSHGPILEDEYIQSAKETSRESSELETPSISILPPTPPPSDEYSEHCRELLELSSHGMTDFAEWANELSSYLNITKIAEASFGEVYRLSLLERRNSFSRNDESVLKIIALKPPNSTFPTDKRKPNAAAKKMESMSRVSDVANEVRLLQRMTDVPGFTNFREIRVIKGRPPQPFIKAFKAFNAAQKARKKELSVFADPAKKTSYADDQLWAVIEMQDAGTDLEMLIEDEQCTSICNVWDIFWQVALSLAKGEEGAEFEHRDLHLGNICVRQPPTTEGADADTKIDTKRKLNFTNLDTTIIDYTISRALMPDSSIAYKDLIPERAIFEGDSTEEYQYEIYRYMRSALFLDDPLADFPRKLPAAAQERSWDQYHPVTNLIWLHFILYKLLEQVAWPSATKAPARAQKAEHARWKRANDLEHVLLRVRDHLDPGSIFDTELRSASNLVVLALNEGWLDHEDVVGKESWEEGGLETELAAQLQDLEIEPRAVNGVKEAEMDVAELRSRTKTRRKKA